MRDPLGAPCADGAVAADTVRGVRKSWKPELNQLGDTDALYVEAQRRVGRLSEEIKVYAEMWVL